MQLLFFEYDSTAAAFDQVPTVQDQFDSFVAACWSVYHLSDLQFDYPSDLAADFASATGDRQQTSKINDLLH